MAITKAQTKSLTKPKENNCDLTDENKPYVDMYQESSTNEVNLLNEICFRSFIFTIID